MWNTAQKNKRAMGKSGRPALYLERGRAKSFGAKYDQE
jgi:hypothetical protein